MKNLELHPIEASHIHARRERFFLLIAGLFLGSLAMLNILGVSRFMVLFSVSDGQVTWGQWGQISFALAVGVLPYPITFLCTDIISEFYGRQRANWVVIVGFLINIWVVIILWIGGVMPPTPQLTNDGTPAVPIVRKEIDESKNANTSETKKEPANSDGNQSSSDPELDRINRDFRADVPPDYAFYKIRTLAFGAVFASMIAYLAAQFCDVYLFHFWKKLTKGKHLWLRNNGSTLVSQLVDTVAVILLTHYFAKGLPIDDQQPLFRQLALFIATGYVFKLIVALLDTIPFYLCVKILSRFLHIDPVKERV